MSAERDVNRIVRSWLRTDEHDSADAILGIVLSRLDTTPQRRSWWPARRSAPMSPSARIAIAAAAVVVIAVIGYNLLPRSESVGDQPTPVPTTVPSPSMIPTAESTLPPGTHMIMPFGPDGYGICPPVTVDPTCVEDPRDDSITFTFEVPESWTIRPDIGHPWIDGNAPPGGVAVFFTRGNWLYSEPCRPDDGLPPDISVGPTVDDFVTALVDHPLLDVTTPVDVTLAGYSGKYLDLQVPDDISGCAFYRPLDGHIYAQGPGHQWHMWVLDVGGVRVVVETNDYPGTSAQRLEEVQGVVDSIVITP